MKTPQARMTPLLLAGKFMTIAAISIISIITMTACNSTTHNPLDLEKENPSSELRPIFIQSLAEGRVRWAAHNLTNYTLDQRYSCFCIPAYYTLRVSNGKVQSVSKFEWPTNKQLRLDSWDSTRTYSVEALFNRVEALQNDFQNRRIASLRVGYDSLYGFPSSINVDPIALAVDDEYELQTKLTGK